MRRITFFFDRLFRRERLDRDLSDEMQFHITQRSEELQRSGVTPEEAARRARVEFGGVEHYKEASRDVRRLSWLHDLAGDLRYGWRSLCNSPGFTAAAVLTLALGIGANTAIFSLVNAVLLRQLPFRDPDRLFTVWEKDENGNRNNTTFATYTDWKAMNQSFQDLALYSSWQPTVQASREPEEVSGLRVTYNFFRTLGIRPALGRDFLPEEDNPADSRVVILSHALWKRSFGSDPSIVGKTITMNSTTYLVAGVLPEDFHSLISLDPRGGPVEIYRVLGYDASLPWACRTCHHLVALGRLRDSVSRSQADAEMDRISAVLFQRYPKDYSSAGVILQPMREYLLGSVSTPLYVLLGAVTLVLLVACANVANLMLARATHRRREMAVRSALGATRGRLVRQLLVENVALGLLGAVAGAIPAYWTPSLLAVLGTGDLPRIGEVRLDWRVLVFTLTLALITGVLSGVAPAWRLSKPHAGEALNQAARASSDRDSNRFRGLLVISEVALSLTLLFGSGLFLRSLYRLLTVSPGFDPNHVLTMRVSLVGQKFQEAKNVRQFFAQATERIQALPGVQAAGVVSEIPLGGDLDRYGLHVEGKMNANPEQDPNADRYCVSPGYRKAMGIPLLRGRDLADTDIAAAPAVILINETTARQEWPGEDPIGKHVKVGGMDGPWWTVVGVVGDVHQQGLDFNPTMQVYLPHAQWPYADSSMFFMIRTAGSPDDMAAPARQAIRDLDSSQPISRIMPLEAYIGLSVQSRRFSLLLVGAFALIAIMLCAVGIYGVTSYTVAQRTREIGIRMALGAQRQTMLALVLGRGLVLVLAGIAVGIVLSIAFTRFLESMLFGIKPTDAPTFLLVSLFLTAVAALACWLPARRAMSVDPMVALRYE